MLLQRLREETHERHRAVERDLDLMRPDLTRADWVRLVGQFYGFYVPWEAAVGRAAAADGEVAQLAAARRKSAWLEGDLTELGVDPATLPRCEALPVLPSPAHALGSMYVFEGATLGGQHISRHVESRLGLTGGRGYSFFRGYGTETGRMWQAFRERVTALAPALDNDIIVASACETFDRFHNWLVDGRGRVLKCP